MNSKFSIDVKVGRRFVCLSFELHAAYISEGQTIIIIIWFKLYIMLQFWIKLLETSFNLFNSQYRILLLFSAWQVIILDPADNRQFSSN